MFSSAHSPLIREAILPLVTSEHRGRNIIHVLLCCSERDLYSTIQAITNKRTPLLTRTLWTGTGYIVLGTRET